jgi:hypothetical protein
MARANPKSPAPSPLQSAYRRALSASVVAHARYLAAHADKSITPHYIAQQKAVWRSMEARKARIQARLMLDGKTADWVGSQPKSPTKSMDRI